jgi:hypothetical protein
MAMRNTHESHTPTITGNMSVAEILRLCPNARRIFDQHGLHGCGGEIGPTEPLSFFAAVHEANLMVLLRELNEELKRPTATKYIYQEHLEDYIYRRFFKAGVVTVLSVGCLWGAINLLQIALGKSFLQLNLLPSIDAHAHAMIFGWVGLFVMGFAYQSFPRFKNTTLWRPDLANGSFYLMLIGIVSYMAAELLAPRLVSLWLAGVSSVIEFSAILIFMTVLYRTARKSLEPHNRYEKFIAGSFVWFLLQALLNDVFFFAKVTAVTQKDLIMRVALIGGPLRDMQTLGFAGLIIAGVSQRLVPLVYGLDKPKRDRQNVIFCLMNASLLLDIICFVLFLTTRKAFFAIGLEAAYILMPVWAILLAKQIGIFQKPAQPDRTFKFIRAAYIWLIVATVMMPLFAVYGALTHQMFSHAYLGAQRHAFTVGFISMMILGVSSRIVPILAGVDTKGLSSLWGAFLLLNLGNVARVTLQILTDFVPRVAYPLLGLSGFIEVIALAWWGIELWKTMNRAKTERAKLLTAPFPILTS